MGKIQGSPYGYKPEDDEEEGSDNRPAFVPEENEDQEEELELGQEGVVVASDAEDEDGEGEGEPKKPFKTFGSQEELDAYIKEHGTAPAAPAPTTPTAPAAPVKPEDKPAEDEDLSSLVFFKGYRDPETGKWVGEAPEDWNDFARKIIGHLSPKNYAPKILSEIQNLTSAQKKEMEEIDKEFDAEYDALATQGKVPARGTKEGDAVNAQISTIGGQYGIPSMTKAYDLWSKIPKDQGGGLDYKSAPSKPNPSKQVSRLISSSRQTQTAGKPKSKMSYNKLHGARSVDELIDED